MKKIFTLLFAIGTITFASAQSTAQQSRHFEDNKIESKSARAGSSHDYDNDRNKESGYGFSVREKEVQMRKINREFDQKIVSVKMNRRLKGQEKSRIIRMLERQRIEEIRQVQSRFEKSNRRLNDRGYDGRPYRS